MKKDLFRNIGKKINDYQSPVDLDNEWNGILNRQQQDKKKEKLFWLLSFFGFFLCITIYLAFPYFKSIETPSSERKNIEESNIDHIPTALNNIISANKKEKIVLSQKGNDIGLFQNSNTENKIISTTKENIEIKNISSTSSTPPTATKLTANNQYQQNSIPLADVAERNLDFSKVALLEKLSTTIPYLAAPVISIKGSKIIIPSTNTSKEKIQLYFSSGLAITQQNFKAKGIEGNDYSNLRSTSETPLETYTYDAGINIGIGKKYFLSVGGNYNISFDKISYQYDTPKAFDLKDVVIKRLVFYPSNDFQDVRGDTTLLGTQTISNTQFNKYRSVNLNASFGYYLLSKNRFDIAVLGGLFYNLHLSKKGKVRSSEDTTDALIELEGYKNSFGLGLIGGLDFDYHINKSLILNLRSTASYSLFSATTKSNLLKSNFHRYGLSLGIKYNLR